MILTDEQIIYVASKILDNSIYEKFIIETGRCTEIYYDSDAFEVIGCSHATDNHDYWHALYRLMKPYGKTCREILDESDSQNSIFAR